jgi:hypothetical protein
MLNDSGVDENIRNELWAECASNATKFTNLISKSNKKCPYEYFYRKNPK